MLLRWPRAYRVARLVHVLARYLARRPHEPEFAAFQKFRSHAGLFLDVGANVGQSALSFRLYHGGSILAIEPNEFHEPELRLLRRLLRRFDFLILAAGEASGVAMLHVPTVRGVPVTGEASLLQGEAERSDWLRRQFGRGDLRDFQVVQRQVPVRRLDDLALAPSFVKIDVEGYELEVLRGLVETLRRHRPILLVERTRRTPAVSRFLADFRYEAFVYRQADDGLEPFRDQPSRNLFYLPAADAA